MVDFTLVSRNRLTGVVPRSSEVYAGKYANKLFPESSKDQRVVRNPKLIPSQKMKIWRTVIDNRFRRPAITYYIRTGIPILLLNKNLKIHKKT